MKKIYSTLTPLVAVDAASLPWWRRVRWWAWVVVVLVVFVYVWAVAIPMYYINQVQVPSVELLNESEGVVIFKYFSGKQGGYKIGLEMYDGRKEMFTCSLGLGGSPDCVLREKVKSLEGRGGRLWWFKVKDNINHYRHYVMRIEIEGADVMSYINGKKFLRLDIERARERFWFTTLVMVIFTYTTIRKGVKRNG